MTSDRIFTDFSEGGREGLGMPKVPKNGLCISTFIVINERGNQRNILAGRINPKAPWDHIGAINPGRLERITKRWMLPSSHLILLESPEAAARRLLKEQLELDESKVQMSKQPIVFSDVSETQHWDIGFIYRGNMDRQDLPKSPSAWEELKFLNFDSTPESDYARFHNYVISYAIG